MSFQEKAPVFPNVGFQIIDSYSSLRGAMRRSNLDKINFFRDCELLRVSGMRTFASLAKTLKIIVFIHKGSYAEMI